MALWLAPVLHPSMLICLGQFSDKCDLPFPCREEPHLVLGAGCEGVKLFPMAEGRCFSNSRHVQAPAFSKQSHWSSCFAVLRHTWLMCSDMPFVLVDPLRELAMVPVNAAESPSVIMSICLAERDESVSPHHAHSRGWVWKCVRAQSPRESSGVAYRAEPHQAGKSLSSRISCEFFFFPRPC